MRIQSQIVLPFAVEDDYLKSIKGDYMKNIALLLTAVLGLYGLRSFGRRYGVVCGLDDLGVNPLALTPTLSR